MEDFERTNLFILFIMKFINIIYYALIMNFYYN